MRKRWPKLSLLLVTIAVAASLAIPGLTSAAEEKNNPGIFDRQPAVKSAINISAAFGKGALIRNITGNASSEGRAHTQGVILGSAFGIADSVADCLVVKCKASQFAMDALVAAVTGGGRGYGISEIHADSPELWAGIEEAAWESVDELGINKLAYE